VFRSALVRWRRRSAASVVAGFTASVVVGVGVVGVVACSPGAPPPSTARVMEIPLGHPEAPRESDAGASATNDDPAAARGAAGEPTIMEAAVGEWLGKSRCDGFDYHPEGGIQSFWCHRPVRIAVASLRSAAGVDIFASGPHAKDLLELEATNDFGHYNPAFVRWLAEKAGPSAPGSAAQKATQSSYDHHLKPLAQIFWKTYAKAIADPACFAREKAAYAGAIARKKLPKQYYERWYFFMNPYFCEKGSKVDTFYYENAGDAGVDGNVTKTVIGFWLRRSMDGTMETFADALKNVLKTYQPALLATPTRFPDPAAITRAIDGGLKGSAACRDPRAKIPSSAADIMISHDGHVSASFDLPALDGTPQAACVQAAFAAQTVPTFDGADLRFNRTIRLK